MSIPRLPTSSPTPQLRRSPPTSRAAAARPPIDCLARYMYRPLHDDRGPSRCGASGSSLPAIVMYQFGLRAPPESRSTAWISSRASGDPPSTAPWPVRHPEGPALAQPEAAMITETRPAPRLIGVVAGQWRRLGDLNPGWARTQTALAVPSLPRKRLQTIRARRSPRRSARLCSVRRRNPPQPAASRAVPLLCHHQPRYELDRRMRANASGGVLPGRCRGPAAARHARRRPG
jgi:hypothetical protein